MKFKKRSQWGHDFLRHSKKLAATRWRSYMRRVGKHRWTCIQNQMAVEKLFREALRELRLKLQKEVLLGWELEERVQIRYRWEKMVETRRMSLEEVGLSEEVWEDGMFGEASRADQPCLVLSN